MREQSAEKIIIAVARHGVTGKVGQNVRTDTTEAYVLHHFLLWSRLTTVSGVRLRCLNGRNASQIFLELSSSPGANHNQTPENLGEINQANSPQPAPSRTDEGLQFGRLVTQAHMATCHP